MLDQLELDLRSLNMSENTVAAYLSDIRQFVEFVQTKRMNVHEVDHGVLLKFVEHMTDKGLKGSTKRRKMEAVKTFYRMMGNMGIVKGNPVADFRDMPKAEDYHMRVLGEMEYRSLRDVIRGNQRKSAVRDYAILELALQTVLRVSEICSLSMDDIEFSTRTTVAHVRIRKGKGGKERLVTLSEVTEKAIKDYLTIRPKVADRKEIFLNNRLKPCNPAVIGGVFKRHMAKAGISGASFQSLRHTFTTHSLRKGTNIVVVSNVVVSDGNRAEVDTELKEGDIAFSDRGFTFKEIPAKYEDLPFIKTPMNSSKPPIAPGLEISFEIDKPAYVYLLWAESMPLPEWLVKDYEDTGDKILMSEDLAVWGLGLSTRPVWKSKKPFEAGEVITYDVTRDATMYIILVEEATASQFAIRSDGKLSKSWGVIKSDH